MNLKKDVYLPRNINDKFCFLHQVLYNQGVLAKALLHDQQHHILFSKTFLVNIRKVIFLLRTHFYQG
jgi:hypothetical protein